MEEKIATSIKERAGKYLTFKMADKKYGFEILTAKKIIGLMVVTELPHTPNYVKDIINLRGKVIPVVNLIAAVEVARTA